MPSVFFQRIELLELLEPVKKKLNCLTTHESTVERIPWLWYDMYTSICLAFRHVPISTWPRVKWNLQLGKLCFHFWRSIFEAKERRNIKLTGRVVKIYRHFHEHTLQAWPSQRYIGKNCSGLYIWKVKCWAAQSFWQWFWQWFLCSSAALRGLSAHPAWCIFRGLKMGYRSICGSLSDLLETIFCLFFLTGIYSGILSLSKRFYMVIFFRQVNANCKWIELNFHCLGSDQDMYTAMQSVMLTLYSSVSFNITCNITCNITWNGILMNPIVRYWLESCKLDIFRI